MRATSIGHAGLLVETARGFDPVRSLVRACVLRVVVPVPAQRRAERRPRRADRTRRLPVRLAPPRRPPRRAVAPCPPPPRHPDPPAGLSDTRATAHAGRPRVQRVHPHGRHRGDRDRTRCPRRDPHRIVDHRRARRRLGPRGDGRRVDPRRPERLPDQRPRPAPLTRSGRPALAAVLRRHLVPDGLRDGRRREARARAMRRSTASSRVRCATSRTSAPARWCRAPVRRASSTPTCSVST